MWSLPRFAFVIAILLVSWREASAVDVTKCQLVADGSATLVDLSGTLDDGRAVTVKGILMVPEGEGPFPAVIMLSGGGGLYTPYCYAAIAQQLGGFGYATLIVAGTTAVTADGNALTQYTFDDQANYARGAAEFLEAHERVVATRLAVWGFSLGGVTAIDLSVKARDRDGPFRAIVAAAPLCPGKVIDQHTPLLVVIGTEDEQVSFSACEEFAKAATGQRDFEHLFLSGARHVFWNDPEAARISGERIRTFLSKHLGDP